MLSQGRSIDLPAQTDRFFRTLQIDIFDTRLKSIEIDYNLSINIEFLWLSILSISVIKRSIVSILIEKIENIKNMSTDNDTAR